MKNNETYCACQATLGPHPDRRVLVPKALDVVSNTCAQPRANKPTTGVSSMMISKSPDTEFCCPVVVPLALDKRKLSSFFQFSIIFPCIFD